MATDSHNHLIMTNINDKQNTQHQLSHQAPLITGKFIQANSNRLIQWNSVVFFSSSFR